MITIAHLYYDLLNLYGESGNIKALKLQLESFGLKVTIKLLTTDDEFHFEDYDFVYMGMGTEYNQLLALKHLLKYKEDIKQAIVNGQFFLITGNSLELFGKYLINREGKKVKTLNIFDYTTVMEEFRIVDEALFQCEFMKSPVLGFQNQFGIIKNIKTPWFNVLKGTGSYPKSKTEGIQQYHFFGTYLIGPLLVRNPELLKYFCKELMKKVGYNTKKAKFHLELETKAYRCFMENYYNDYLEVK